MLPARVTMPEQSRCSSATRKLRRRWLRNRRRATADLPDARSTARPAMPGIAVRRRWLKGRALSISSGPTPRRCALERAPALLRVTTSGTFLHGRPSSYAPGEPLSFLSFRIRSRVRSAPPGTRDLPEDAGIRSSDHRDAFAAVTKVSVRSRPSSLPTISDDSSTAHPAMDSRHTRHDLSRFAARRLARASVLLASSSLGMPSPMPKYISSGVWPRNAECGSRVLCSST